MHVGGICVFEGSVPREAVVQRVRERVHLIPRYAMRLDEAPLGLANPAWVDDESFDPDRHVRRAAIPAPGGDAELCELVGQLLSEPLDRGRPLWQMTLVEGLAGGRTALVAKMHHALVDGMAAVDVSNVILDPTPEPLDIQPPERASSASKPGRTARLEGLTRLASAQLALPRSLAREAVTRTMDPRTYASQLRGAASLAGELARVRPQAPDTRLNAAIGRDRVFSLARCSLEEIKSVRRATGATVNDVLLTVVALMLSRFLGAGAPEHAVALVPVSVRTDEDQGELGNRISTVFVDLPLTGTPLERLDRVSAAMDDVKGSAQVRAGALIVGATGLAPPVVSSLAVRAMSGPRMFNLVVSNVPGPQQTLYLGGVPLREVYPAVPLNPRNQALSIGIVSYDGGVGFGLLGDRDAMADIGDAAAGLEAAVAELVNAVGGTTSRDVA